MLYELFDRYKANVRIRQSALLLFATFVSLPLGIVSNILVTRYLGSSGYGDLMHVINIFNLSALVFSFGVFQAGNRALVLTKDDAKAKQLHGALLLCLAVLSAIMSTALLIYGLLDGNLHEKGLTSYFLCLMPFGMLFLAPCMFEVVLQADNKITELAQSRIMTAVGHLALYAMVFFLLTSLDDNRLMIIMACYILTNLVIVVFLATKLKPSFEKSTERVTEILAHTRSYGFHVYVGSVIGVGMSYLSGILISYYSAKNIGVGHYALALAFASPLKLIPNTVATVYYKDFSKLRTIPLRLTLTTIAISLTAIVALALIIHPFVDYFYGSEFMPVVFLTYWASLGALFYGMADYYNRYLGACGKGIALRNSAIAVGVVLLLANLIFIPMWVEKGAIIAYVFSGAFYLVAMMVCYRRCSASK